jgi:hypothetical protein
MELPESVQEIAAVIGDERALYLIGNLPTCYCGTPGHKSNRAMLYVPTMARLKPSHELVLILGWECAVKLVKAFGGEILKPANCTAIYREFRDANILRLVGYGAPAGVVAEWFAVSERLVKNLIRENPQVERRSANDNNVGIKTTITRRTHEKNKITSGRG